MKNLLLTLCLSTFCLAAQASKLELRLKEFKTTAGAKIAPLTLGYETWGKLNADKSNAILVIHHFSGNSHAEAYWGSILGPGKAIDTQRFFVIAMDSIANLATNDPSVVTTGPASLDPATKKPYGMSFPLVQIADFVKAQKALIDELGIKRLHAVMGPSAGGIQTAQWLATYPTMMTRAIAVIAPGFKLPPFAINLMNLWRAPITLDPHWMQGEYYGKTPPLQGLTEALKLITFFSVQAQWSESNGGNTWASKSRDPMNDYNNLFQVEAALDERAKTRAMMADANSLLYTAKAMQPFNVEAQMKDIQAPVLFIPAGGDLIFPPELSQAAVTKLCSMGKVARLFQLPVHSGHLAGLTQIQLAESVIREFLSGAPASSCDR